MVKELALPIKFSVAYITLVKEFINKVLSLELNWLDVDSRPLFPVKLRSLQREPVPGYDLMLAGSRYNTRPSREIVGE
jgi:hypothetical protein